jgi:hypothetical protein
MIEISTETEARINDEARRQGVSVEALLERLIGERASAAHIAGAGAGAAPKLPRLNLGVMGSLHRREIYDDVR